MPVGDNSPLSSGKCDECGEKLSAGKLTGLCTICASEQAKSTLSFSAADTLPISKDGSEEPLEPNMFKRNNVSAQRHLFRGMAKPQRLAGKLRRSRGNIVQNLERYLTYHNEDGEQVTPITQHLTRIGRGVCVDIRFDDATVSRRHALIISNGQDVYLVDDRSLNGVFVNGVRVSRQLLNDGDEIMIGRHVVRYLERSLSNTVDPSALGKAAEHLGSHYG